MNSNELKLKDVSLVNLELVIDHLSVAQKAFNNSDFITPTDIQLVILKVVKHYKITLWEDNIDIFNKDVLFSCIYKDIKSLNEWGVSWDKLIKILNTIITNVWDNNSNFTKKSDSLLNIIKYFEYIKFSWVSKTEANIFINSLEFKSKPKPNSNNERDTTIDDGLGSIRNMFDKNNDSNPFGIFSDLFWKK